ncbi:MAG: ATP-grasp domain-containing protein [Pseudomonadota bacterium]
MSGANILVSGIGGDIGFGIGRILRDFDGLGAISGIDIHADHAGPAIFDHCAVAPRATDPDYLKWISRFIGASAIDLFIPTSEAELTALFGLPSIGRARILQVNRSVAETCLDKHECLTFLAAQGVAVPSHGIVGQSYPDTYPIIVKPRSGQGSKGLMRIDNRKGLDAAQQPGQVWQSYLLPDDEEYTCAVFRTPSVQTRILVLRRTLQGGFTGKGEVVENATIYAYVEQIARVLDLDGAMNVQLRLTADGPLLFEINPRLSSTLVFRDKLGFQDLRWWLCEAFGLDTPVYRAPRAGVRFFRGVQEYILSPGRPD